VSEPRKWEYPFGWQSEAQPIAALIRLGALIPVTVFGNCAHPVPTHPAYAAQTGESETTCEDESHWSYGLMDLMSEHSPGGSDCNRASSFLLRPSDEAMADPLVREAIEHVLRVEADAHWNGAIDEAEPATLPESLTAIKASFDEMLARIGHPELEWSWGEGPQRREGGRRG
jgi:hypothetical protein